MKSPSGEGGLRPSSARHEECRHLGRGWSRPRGSTGPAWVAHPLVTPPAAMALMAASWLLPPMSVNCPGSPEGSWKARTRKDAIWSRVTGWVGQKRSGSVAQPWVTPSSAIRSHIRRPPPGGFHIGESAGLHARWFGFVEDSHQPDGHDPALDRMGRTEPVRRALGPLQDALLRQPLHRRSMRSRFLDVGEPVLVGDGRTRPNQCQDGCRAHHGQKPTHFQVGNPPLVRTRPWDKQTAQH